MAQTIDEVQVVITADNSDVNKKLKQTDKQTDKTKNKFIELGKTVAGPFVAGAVITALVRIGKESEKAFQVQEKAVEGVNAALKSTGQFTEEASQDIQSYASSLQEITTIGDETTLSLIQTALNMGLNADQAKEAAKQAIGMSEAFGVGLDTSLRAVANSTLGNFDALTRYLPALKTADTEAEKAAIVQEQLANAFDIATANAKTAAGIQTQLSNNVGDLQETVGGLISSALTPWRAKLSDVVVEINKSIQAQILQNRVASGQATIVEKLINKQNEQLKIEKEIEQAKANIEAATNRENSAYANQFVQLQNLDQVVNTALIQAEETLKSLESQKSAIDRQVDSIQRQVQAENERTQAAIEAATLISEAEEEKRTEAQETADLLTELAVRRIVEAEQEAEAIKDREKRRAEAAEEAAAAAAEAQREANKELEEYIRLLGEAQISAEDLARVGLSSITSGFETIGKAIVDGGLNFETFGKLALGALGDVLSSLGAQLAAQAALLFFGLFPDPVRGAGAAAASAAAFTAAGIAKALAFEDGGSFTTSGPQNIVVGDNPGGVERVTVEPVSSAGANERFAGGQGGSMIFNIDGTQFRAWMQSQLDNGNLRVPRRILT